MTFVGRKILLDSFSNGKITSFLSMKRASAIFIIVLVPFNFDFPQLRHNLRPSSEKNGREVVHHLMKLALLNKEDFVFILAGYKDDISRELYR